MNRLIRILKWFLLLVIGLVLLLVAYAFLAPIPERPDINVATLREEVTQPYHLLETSDGETLFIRRWDPVVRPARRDVAVLILHGITAHSGAYDFMAEPLAAAGYTTFGLDYRGHGLSGGTRGDSPGKDRSQADRVEALRFIENLGFSKVVVLGHSLGVASAIYLAKEVPGDIAGLVLLSGAYQSKLPPRKFGFFERLTILTNAVLRPGRAVIEYQREGHVKSKDPLFTYAYTLRFVTMLDMDELVFDTAPPYPVLVGMGDQDELFSVAAARELYERIPGEDKDFWVMKGALHATFPPDTWLELVAWLDAQGF